MHFLASLMFNRHRQALTENINEAPQISRVIGHRCRTSIFEGDFPMPRLIAREYHICTPLCINIYIYVHMYIYIYTYMHTALQCYGK